MTATEHQQRTARLLLDWWNFTGGEHFLHYAMKTVSLFDVEGRRGIFEEQCRRLHSRLSVHRKQIEFKRHYGLK